MSPDELFEQNMYLVKKTLYKTYHDVRGLAKSNHIEVEDLMQMGYTGLWKGCLSWNPDKGTQIRTHCINHIKWHLIERLKRETSLIKYDSNKFNDIEKYGIMSMDAEHSDGSDGHNTYHDIITDDSINVETSVIGKFEEDCLLSTLNDRQRGIVKLIEKGLNTNDIARLWNMSGSNVRWHYAKAKKQLENYVEVV
jgi:RNA polymerase sigma factor (sigma-70 family)